MSLSRSLASCRRLADLITSDPSSAAKTATEQSPEMRALSQDPSPAAAARPDAMVENFAYSSIEGWVDADEALGPVRIALCINDLEVTSTHADLPSKHNSNNTNRKFKFVLKDIWKFCKRTDRVTLRIDGQPIPIAQKGMYKRPGKDGASSLEELAGMLESGYLFRRDGRLRVSKVNDHAWQRDVMELYQKVRHTLQQEKGYDPFVIYGSLLGLVREGNFIGHDDDFDAAYLSRCTDGPSAATELHDIALMLIDRGFDVECKYTALHIKDPDVSNTRIDLFHLYFDEEGKLSFPFGIAGTSTIHKEDWQGTQEADLGGHPVQAPINAEAMAEHIYGPSWRIPITGFHWGQARTTSAREGLTRAEHREEVYWANFYAHTQMSTNSTFCDFVQARDDVPRAVLDIGCGDGRDTFGFASAGSQAIGFDRSHVAVRHAAKKARQAGLAGKLSFVAGDVSDKATVQQLFEQGREMAEGSELLFYMRFFLHSIPENIQAGLMEMIASAARPGDMLAAEFRTDKDEELHKVHGGHYRRYQSGQAFSEALTNLYGFQIVHEEERAGLSPYGDEDPVLYRVIAHVTG